MPGAPLEHRASERVGARLRAREHARHHLGGEPRQVDERDEGGRGGGALEGAQTRAQRGGEPLLPVVGDDDRDIVWHERARLGGARPEHDGDVGASARPQRGHGELQPWGARLVAPQRLRPARAGARAGGEHETRHVREIHHDYS